MTMIAPTTTAEAIASRYQLLTVKDVRQRLRVSVSTLYRWMEAGKFPKPIPIGDTCVRWREEDLAAWIESKAATGPRPGRNRSDK